jgi:hypothetical protein
MREKAARIGPRGWLCNAALVATAALAGCGEDPPAPLADGGDAAVSAAASLPGGKPPLPSEAKVADAGPPAPPIPVEPLPLLTRLPDPPSIAAVAPGAPGAELRRQRPGLRPSVYTPRILQERLPPDDAFERVAYELGPDDRVVAILLTFAPPYRHPDRWQEVLKAAEARLGAGIGFNEAPYTGTRWSVPGWRVDLRRDGPAGEVQLLFHLRGGRDLGLP